MVESQILLQSRIEWNKRSHQTTFFNYVFLNLVERKKNINLSSIPMTGIFFLDKNSAYI